MNNFEFEERLKAVELDLNTLNNDLSKLEHSFNTLKALMVCGLMFIIERLDKADSEQNKMQQSLIKSISEMEKSLLNTENKIDLSNKLLNEFPNQSISTITKFNEILMLFREKGLSPKEILSLIDIHERTLYLYLKKLTSRGYLEFTLHNDDKPGRSTSFRKRQFVPLKDLG